MVPVVAHGADEMGDPAPRIAPDFRSSAEIMGQRIIGIGELVQHLALTFPFHPGGQIPSPLHAFVPGHQDNLGAKGPHRSPPLGAHVGRHDQHHPVTLDGRRHRQRNAGVAAGSLDEGVARPDVSPRLGALDHAEGGTVLHRTRRIVAFQLAQNDVAGSAGQPLQAHQGGIADNSLNGRKTRCWDHGFEHFPERR